MALNVTNSLIADITSTDDASQNVEINFGTGNPAIDSNVAELRRFMALVGGANVINLPKSPCTQVYIKNIDPAKTITVNWTLNGGAAQNVIILNINAQLILWDDPAAATTPCITTLTLTPSVAGAFVEYFLGG